MCKIRNFPWYISGCCVHRDGAKSRTTTTKAVSPCEQEEEEEKMQEKERRSAHMTAALRHESRQPSPRRRGGQGAHMHGTTYVCTVAEREREREGDGWNQTDGERSGTAKTHPRRDDRQDGRERTPCSAPFRRLLLYALSVSTLFFYFLLWSPWGLCAGRKEPMGDLKSKARYVRVPGLCLVVATD